MAEAGAKRIGRPPTKFFTEEERKQGARDRANAWRINNPEKVKANQEKNKPGKSEYNKNYAIEHVDEIKERRAIRKAEDPEKSKEQSRKWREENPDYGKQYRVEHVEEIKEYRDNYYQEHSQEKADYRKSHAEERKVYDKDYRIKYTAIPANRMRRLVGAARIRAKRDGLEFDEEILEKFVNNPPTHCECCKGKFDYTVGKGLSRQNISPSLDRVDNSKGYTFDNTCVICFKCNALKSCATLEEIGQIYFYVKKPEPILDTSFLLW